MNIQFASLGFGFLGLIMCALSPTMPIKYRNIIVAITVFTIGLNIAKIHGFTI